MEATPRLRRAVRSNYAGSDVFAHQLPSGALFPNASNLVDARRRGALLGFAASEWLYELSSAFSHSSRIASSFMDKYGKFFYKDDGVHFLH